MKAKAAIDKEQVQRFLAALEADGAASAGGGAHGGAASPATSLVASQGRPMLPISGWVRAKRPQ